MNQIIISVVGCLIIVVGAAALVPVQTALVVTDTETDEQIIDTEVTDGTPVYLEYTHSVERTPVTESYEVSGTKLVQNEILFRSSGAGLPVTANMTSTDKGFVVPLDEQHDSITVALDPTPNHTLVVDDHQYHLLKKADGSVRMEIEERSLLEMIVPVSTSTERSVYAVSSYEQNNIGIEHTVSEKL